MPTRAAPELRAEAKRLRECATQGDDASLRIALLELADEFEREAAMAEDAVNEAPADKTEPAEPGTDDHDHDHDVSEAGSA